MPVWLMPGFLPLSRFLSKYSLKPLWLLNRPVLLITTGSSLVEFKSIVFALSSLWRCLTVRTSSAGWGCTPLPSPLWLEQKIEQWEWKEKEWWGGDYLGHLSCWLYVRIWSPDDLCLQSRLALSCFCSEREGQRESEKKERERLRLSGNPQPCTLKARVGMLCQKPTEQLWKLYLKTAVSGSMEQIRVFTLHWDFYPDILAELAMLREPRMNSCLWQLCLLAVRVS